MNKLNKRKFQRTLFDTEGLFIHPKGEVAFKLCNISLKGALAESDSAEIPAIGCEGIFQIEFDQSNVGIKADAVLIHNKGNRLGFHFVKIDLDSMIHLRRLMEFNTADAEAIETELGFLYDT